MASLAIVILPNQRPETPSRLTLIVTRDGSSRAASPALWQRGFGPGYLPAQEGRRQADYRADFQQLRAAIPGLSWELDPLEQPLLLVCSWVDRLNVEASFQLRLHEPVLWKLSKKPPIFFPFENKIKHIPKIINKYFIKCFSFKRAKHFHNIMDVKKKANVVVFNWSWNISIRTALKRKV